MIIPNALKIARRPKQLINMHVFTRYPQVIECAFASQRSDLAHPYNDAVVFDRLARIGSMLDLNGYDAVPVTYTSHGVNTCLARHYLDADHVAQAPHRYTDQATYEFCLPRFGVYFKCASFSDALNVEAALSGAGFEASVDLSGSIVITGTRAGFRYPWEWLEPDDKADA